MPSELSSSPKSFPQLEDTIPATNSSNNTGTNLKLKLVMCENNNSIEATLSFNGGHQYFENMAHSMAECEFFYFSQPTLDSFILSGVFKTQTC